MILECVRNAECGVRSECRMWSACGVRKFAILKKSQTKRRHSSVAPLRMTAVTENGMQKTENGIL